MVPIINKMGEAETQLHYSNEKPIQHITCSKTCHLLKKKKYCKTSSSLEWLSVYPLLIQYLLPGKYQLYLTMQPPRGRQLTLKGIARFCPAALATPPNVTTPCIQCVQHHCCYSQHIFLAFPKSCFALMNLHDQRNKSSQEQYGCVLPICINITCSSPINTDF